MVHFEINVSLNGKHFFATSDRSLKDDKQTKEMYKLFLNLFPKEKGYSISVTKWEKIGQIINFSEE